MHYGYSRQVFKKLWYILHSTSYINPEYHKSMIKWTKEIKLCKVFIYYIEHVTYILTQVISCQYDERYLLHHSIHCYRSHGFKIFQKEDNILLFLWFHYWLPLHSPFEKLRNAENISWNFQSMEILMLCQKEFEPYL